MPDWLNSWTNTRYINQQELAKRWAYRGEPEADEPPAVMPIEDSKYILTHGKKAYRRWIASGCPDKMASTVCPVLSMVSEFFMRERYGVWRPSN
jgi:hypothetical protein